MTVYWLIDLIIYIKKAFFANERQKKQCCNKKFNGHFKNL